MDNVQGKNKNTQNITPEEEHFLKLIQKRWSPRSFSDEKIPIESIQQIFEAGKTIMSSFNEQPWRIIFAFKDDPHYSKLFDCLGEFNQDWARTAPCLGVVVAKKHFTKKDKINRHRFYDSGAFMAAATLRATSMGLFAHQMAGFTPQKVVDHFDLPDEFEPITMFVIGKPTDPGQLPEDLRKQETKKSERKELDEFLYQEWEVPYRKA
ncbi:nitroreductase family protein [Sunxiuqinia indica]|uniref:nitroreductase family protein n=1 Tax=Sunxiuqinia indica TaxID=2692584 RepID=UPI00135BBD4F|nr:nitroreductase family protein [Sunxiuqinia indica]